VSEISARPPHTSMVAGFVIGGSAAIVVSIAGQLSSLHSLETQERIATFLSEPPGSGLGLDIEGATDLLRVVLMVVAGCCTAAIVLGVEVLRRNRRARLGLSLLAAPIFLGGFVAGGFLTALVTASIVLLWVGPSAAWLHDGRPTSNRGFLDRPPSREPATPAAHPGPSRPHAPVPPPLHQPPPPPSPAARQLFLDQPPTARVGSRRPDAVVWACVLVWTFCGIAVVVMSASVALLAGNPDVVLDQLQRQDADLAGGDTDLLLRATYVTAAVIGVWSLVAAVLATLAFRRGSGGRLGVIVCSGVAGAVCLVGVFTSVVLIVPAGAAMTTVALLSRPEVRDWYAHR
jgi:hypothetical protein